MNWLNDTPTPRTGGREKTIERAIITELERQGATVLNTTGVAAAGTPDLIACYRGRCLALETKTAAGKATPLQRHRLKTWAAAGAHAEVVRSRAQLLELLQKLDQTINTQGTP